MNLKQIYKRLLQFIFMFSFCGMVYCTIELLFRQRTDITMFGLAGICGLISTGLNNIFTYDMLFELQVLIATICTTVAEFITGILFNADFTIWDYRHLPGTFANGQCNIFFCLAWAVIIVFAIPICDYIEWRFFNYEKPYYRFLMHREPVHFY